MKIAMRLGFLVAVLALSEANPPQGFPTATTIARPHAGPYSRPYSRPGQVYASSNQRNQSPFSAYIPSHSPHDNGAGAQPYRAPATAYTAPASTYQAPASTYQVPASTYRAPASTYRAPASTYRAPASTYYSPASTYHAPASTYRAPATTYHAPATTYHAPAQPYRPATPYHAPAQPYRPATPYHAPAQPYQAPATPYHVPAQPYHASAQPYRPATPYAAPATPYNDPTPSYGAEATAYVAPDTSYGEPDTPYGEPATSYGVPDTSYGYQTPATSTFDTSSNDSDSSSWDSGDTSSYDNEDSSTYGGANRKIIQNASGDSFYRGDDKRSKSEHATADYDDGEGNVNSRNYDSNNASSDVVDNSNGFATAKADVSYGDGQSRSVTDDSSRYGSYNDDSQRSRDVSDDSYKATPYGQSQTNYRDSAASSAKNQDNFLDALSAGNILSDFGKSVDSFAVGSSDKSHKGEDESSYNTDAKQLSDDGDGAQQTEYHAGGATAGAANDSETTRRNKYSGSRNYGKDTMAFDKYSKDGSKKDSRDSNAYTDKINRTDGPGGVFSSRDSNDSRSSNKMDAATSVASDDSAESSDYGYNTKESSKKSNLTNAAVDNTASNVNSGYAAGNDGKDEFSTNYANNASSDLKKVVKAESNKDKGSYSEAGGANKGAYSKGGSTNTSKGSSKNSKTSTGTGAAAYVIAR